MAWDLVHIQYAFIQGRHQAPRLLHIFSCSTHLNMKLIKLIIMKCNNCWYFVGILTFISLINTVDICKSLKAYSF